MDTELIFLAAAVATILTFLLQVGGIVRKLWKFSREENAQKKNDR